MSGIGRARMAGRREQAACRSAGTLDPRWAGGADRQSRDAGGTALNACLALVKRMF